MTLVRMRENNRDGRESVRLGDKPTILFTRSRGGESATLMQAGTGKPERPAADRQPRVDLAAVCSRLSAEEHRGRAFCATQEEYRQF
jgi:hypothetical protein